MSTFSLPDEIDIDAGSKMEDLIFHYYTAPTQTFYGRSILTKNAISLVISGDKTMQFAERKIEISDREIHFLSTGNCLVSMKLSEVKPFRSILIFFDNRIWTNFLVKYQRRIEQLTKGKKIDKVPFLRFGKDPFIHNYIASLVLRFESELRLSAEMKMIKFEELMLHLLEHYPAEVLSFQSLKGHERGDLELRKVVERNVTSNMSLTDMAFLCHLSLSTFKRRFLKIYGVPPRQWLIERRMELAREFLIQDREKPGEIFHKLGYANHSSFSQSFRQVYGVTPTAFQAQHLNVQQQQLNGQP